MIHNIRKWNNQCNAVHKLVAIRYCSIYKAVFIHSATWMCPTVFADHRIDQTETNTMCAENCYFRGEQMRALKNLPIQDY